ncbi:sugar phosphate isomerase/epimerase family protein [Microtetraspora malaysiensis]|uniref:sugar phosphate isomerase/epimerase family protein n=1 Tax=Microtetraspora malaysiensis TaxID=161358 RepID=UPI00082F9C3F|nr:TIM barrel protein [Microtetraspora malaysiensis]
MCGPTQGIEEGDWPAALDLVRELGLDGVMFPTPRAVSPSLDRAELRDARQAADHQGLFVEVGVGCLGPHGDLADRLAELTRMVDAAVALGCDQFYAYTMTNRRSTSPSHREQLGEIGKTLAALRPVLMEHGLRLNVKTHEDLASTEVLQLVETAGPDVFGVSLDVANLVVRAEDPGDVTRRLAPHVHQSHLEDVALFFAGAGLRRKLRPCGDGVLDWTAILRSLVHDSPVTHLVFEQHRGQFDTEIFLDDWFDSEPHVCPRELARLVRAAVRCERSAAEGRGPRLEDLSSQADADGRRAELLRSIGHVRSVLASCSEGDPAR